MAGSYKDGGWRDKYVIAKADGSLVDEGAIYFVLRIDADPNAVIAAQAYAASVAADNPQLSRDVYAWAYGLRAAKVDHPEQRAKAVIEELLACYGIDLLATREVS